MKKTAKVSKKRATARPIKIAEPAPREETVLVLRVCKPDMSSSHGFVWPTAGAVACQDWRDDKECGHGLHGWLWGAGDLSVAGDVDKVESARWLVVEVVKSKIIDLSGKVKFPSGAVVFCGERDAAVKIISGRAPAGTAVLYGTATAGYAGTATAGDAGTATAGYAGTATAGYAGTATAGYAGTATAGSRGTATAGDAGTATAGEGGNLSIEYYDPKRNKYRRAIAEVGENGIEPNTAYVIDVSSGEARFAKKGS